MGPGFEDPVREIVGVVGDIKQTGLDQTTPVLCICHQGKFPDRMTQMDNGLLGTSWLVRTKFAQVDVATAAGASSWTTRNSIASVDPLDVVVSASVAEQRFSMYPALRLRPYFPGA